MIDICSLTKIFKTGGEAVRAVDAVDLRVNEKEFFVLLGLSGSGKTTLLRCVAGLEKADAGEIKLGEEIVTWSEPGDFLEKVLFYSRNERAAARVREAGQQRALRDHTWQHRFDRLFSHLRSQGRMA